MFEFPGYTLFLLISQQYIQTINRVQGVSKKHGNLGIVISSSSIVNFYEVSESV